MCYTVTVLKYAKIKRDELKINGSYSISSHRPLGLFAHT